MLGVTGTDAFFPSLSSEVHLSPANMPVEMF